METAANWAEPAKVVADITAAATGLLCAQNLINGAGATFPYPMYSKWFDEYRKLAPAVQINYQSLGSGAGIKQVTEGTVRLLPRITVTGIGLILM